MNKNNIQNKEKKEVKNNKKASYKKNKSQHWYSRNELTKLVFTFIIVIVVFIAFYLLTILIKNNTSSDDDFIESESAAVIQYEKILVGEIFNMNQNSYYVLILKDFEENEENYKQTIDNYLLKEDAYKVYYVDLKSAFNKKFLSSDSNLEISSISDIRFKEDTLLKIEDKKIVNTYEGKNNIVEHLKSL